MIFLNEFYFNVRSYSLSKISQKFKIRAPLPNCIQIVNRSFYANIFLDCSLMLRRLRKGLNTDNTDKFCTMFALSWPTTTHQPHYYTIPHTTPTTLLHHTTHHTNHITTPYHTPHQPHYYTITPYHTPHQPHQPHYYTIPHTTPTTSTQHHTIPHLTPQKVSLKYPEWDYEHCDYIPPCW